MLINRRNALFGGKRLPYDAEVEWVYMPYGSYLNTGFYGVDYSDFDISLTVKADGYPEAAATLVGAYGTSTSGGRSGGVIIRQYPSGTIQSYVGSNFTSTDITRAMSMPSNFFTARLTTLGFYVENVLVGTNFDVSTWDSSRMNYEGLWFCVNGRKDWRWTGQEPQKGVLCNAAGWYKGVRILNSGILVRDLIPVRRTLDGVSVGEMYDRVTGTFMERHGTFVIGADVASGASAANYAVDKARFNLPDAT